MLLFPAGIRRVCVNYALSVFIGYEYLRAVRVDSSADRFLVHLRYAFQTKTKLYVLTDFYTGGELWFSAFRICLCILHLVNLSSQDGASKGYMDIIDQCVALRSVFTRRTVKVLESTRAADLTDASCNARYHLRRNGRFSEEATRFYVGEILLALECARFWFPHRCPQLPCHLVVSEYFSPAVSDGCDDHRNLPIDDIT